MGAPPRTERSRLERYDPEAAETPEGATEAMGAAEVASAAASMVACRVGEVGWQAEAALVAARSRPLAQAGYTLARLDLVVGTAAWAKATRRG